MYGELPSLFLYVYTRRLCREHMYDFHQVSEAFIKSHPLLAQNLPQPRHNNNPNNPGSPTHPEEAVSHGLESKFESSARAQGHDSFDKAKREMQKDNSAEASRESSVSLEPGRGGDEKAQEAPGGTCSDDIEREREREQVVFRLSGDTIRLRYHELFVAAEQDEDHFMWDLQY